MNESRTWLTICVALGLAATNETRAAATFQGLGGTDVASVTDVSGDGRVIVGTVLTGNIWRPFRWTADAGMSSIELGSGSSEEIVQAVSHDGAVVVGYAGLNAYRWAAATGYEPIVGSGANALGVSDDGNVVVGYGSGEAFRWTSEEGMRSLGQMPGGGRVTEATAVSGDGSVIVGQGAVELGSMPFRWTASGGVETLGDFAGGRVSGNAYAVSADGQVIVGQSEGTLGMEAFCWTESDGMQGLGFLPGGEFHSTAWDASGDGSVIVGAATVHGGSRTAAFIWDARNGMRDLQTVLVEGFGLNLEGWTLNEAMAVSDDGLTIAGTGSHFGTWEGFVVHLPEPTTLTLLALGGLVLARRRRPRC